MQPLSLQESRRPVRSERVEESPARPAGEGFADLKNPIRPRLVHGTDFH